VLMLKIKVTSEESELTWSHKKRRFCRTPCSRSFRNALAFCQSSLHATSILGASIYMLLYKLWYSVKHNTFGIIIAVQRSRVCGVREFLILSPNPGTGHTSAGRTPTTTVRRRRPGTRSEPQHFAGGQPGIGFPHRSGCRCRWKLFTGACGSVMWTSPNPGNTEHTIRSRVRVSRSRAPTLAALGTRPGGCRVSGGVAVNPVAQSGDHFM
jgi:hypothetical protein